MLENCNCPLTHVPMRHPIIVTDCEGKAHRYELSVFMDYLQMLNGREPVSPMSNKRIISVGYDTAFKQILDGSPDLEGRHPEYEININMQNLNALFPQRQNSNYIKYLRYPSVRAAGVGVACYLAVNVFYHHLMMHDQYPSLEHTDEDVRRSYSVPIGIMAGVLDYGIRCSTNNRYSLTSTLFNLSANVIEPIKNKTRDVINQIHRRHQV